MSKTDKTAEFKTIHGVFMQVHGAGVLLSGASGIGKSELALGLLGRGHCLVADDIVEFHLEKNEIIGRCPVELQDFLEVRGLGIIDIRALFGENAIVTAQSLMLIIKLAHFTHKQIQQIDRLEGLHKQRRILGKEIPEVTLPVTSGRNLAVLTECAVRNYQLKQSGYDACQRFMERQQHYMTKSHHETHRH